MNKLQKLLKGIGLLLRKPYLINHIVESQDVYQNSVVKLHKLPDGLPQIPLSILLNGDTETVAPYAFLDGGSLATDLALLRALARRYHVENYLEIGTWRGESVANVAPLVKNCFTLNLPDETMRQMKLPESYIRSHRFFSEGLRNVTHIQSHSHTFDYDTLPAKPDMIFIDGDHHYASVKKDTENIFAMLKNDNAIVVWHDYARTPEIIRWEVLKGILDGCPPAQRQHLYHVSHTLCAVYLKGDFDSTFMKPYSLPDTVFKVQLSVGRVRKG